MINMDIDEDDYEPNQSIPFFKQGQQCFTNSERRIPLIDLTIFNPEPSARRTPLIDASSFDFPLTELIIDSRIPIIDLTDCEPEPSGSQSSSTFDSIFETPKTEAIIDNDSNNELRIRLIRRCEETMKRVKKEKSAGRHPKISYRKSTMETMIHQLESLDSEFRDQEISEESQETCELGSVFETPESMESINPSQVFIEDRKTQRIVVDSRRKSSQQKFHLMMKVITKVHRLLIENCTQTRRSLYYELKSDETFSKLVKNPEQIDNIVFCVASHLECSPWQTRLVGTAKGLAHGNLTIHFSNNEVINFNVHGGVLISSKVTEILAIESKAEFVIVVEKDTVFQQLMENDFTAKNKCLLITGKGYPDVPTRMLVKILRDTLKIPIFIIVDANPHGIEIMLNYKYGSINMCHDVTSLSCPSAQWLGILPSELTAWRIPSVPLTDGEIKKLRELKERPYINDDVRKELEMLREGKAEIEALEGLSSLYLPMKIFAIKQSSQSSQSSYRN